jgi:hypothetical protein
MQLPEGKAGRDISPIAGMGGREFKKIQGDKKPVHYYTIGHGTINLSLRAYFIDPYYGISWPVVSRFVFPAAADRPAGAIAG